MDVKFFSPRTANGGSPARAHGWVLLVAVMTLLAGACKKTNGSGPSQQTLKAFFSTGSRYTLFNRALQRTHLDSLLGGTNPYTVFAVCDSAMTQAGYTAAGIDSADIGVLTGILRYHLVPGAIDTMNVDLYKETILTTADSNYLAYLEYNNFGLFYNGIPLVSVGNRLVNGVVHGMQSMARPPLGDLVTTIVKTKGLSDFGYIIAKAANTVNLNGWYNGIVSYISSTPAAPTTLFLPDDAFYASLGFDSYTALLQLSGAGPPAFMTQGQYFTSDFIGKNAINEYSGTYPTGRQLWFSADGSNFVEASTGLYSTSLTKRYRIVQSNIVTTNAIIHVIEPY